MEKKVTSIRISPEVMKEAKHYAIEKGLSLSDLIETALKKEMKK